MELSWCVQGTSTTLTLPETQISKKKSIYYVFLPWGSLRIFSGIRDLNLRPPRDGSFWGPNFWGQYEIRRSTLRSLDHTATYGKFNQYVFLLWGSLWILSSVWDSKLRLPSAGSFWSQILTLYVRRRTRRPPAHTAKINHQSWIQIASRHKAVKERRGRQKKPAALQS